MKTQYTALLALGQGCAMLPRDLGVPQPYGQEALPFAPGTLMNIQAPMCQPGTIITHAPPGALVAAPSLQHSQQQACMPARRPMAPARARLFIPAPELFAPLKAPTTSTCAGQSTGLGQSEGEYIIANGTRHEDKSEPVRAHTSSRGRAAGATVRGARRAPPNAPKRSVFSPKMFSRR